MKEAVVSILHRAVELDQSRRFTEALLLYQEGIQMLLDLRKCETGEKSAYYLKKIEEYMSRAEAIKKTIEELKQQGKYHEQINIKGDSMGYSYTKVFGRFLDGDVTNILIEDPYIRAYHQVQNLIRFMEVLVKHCCNVKFVRLVTSGHAGERAREREQEEFFNNLKRDLKQHYSVDLVIEFSSTLHDRKISLSNGWIIKIGRGLDYFKAPRSKNCIGTYDMDLRPCHETTVDIFHSNSVVQK